MVTVWTPQAIAELRKAYDYISKDSPQNARKVINLHPQPRRVVFFVRQWNYCIVFTHFFRVFITQRYPNANRRGDRDGAMTGIRRKKIEYKIKILK